MCLLILKASSVRSEIFVEQRAQKHKLRRSGICHSYGVETRLNCFLQRCRPYGAYNFNPASVTAPSDALVTVCAYFASTPRG